MRAIVLDAFGGNEHLQLADLPLPEPAKDEVVIRVHAVGVAIWDAMVRSGNWPYPLPLPMVPGFEGAGTIDRVGAGVHDLFAEEAVYAYMYAPPQGFWAEYVAVPAAQVARKPASISFIQAAALPVAVITARQGLDPLQLGPGKTVVIAGGGGGVGTIAIQLAKNAGATVVATGGPASEPLCRDLGADAYLDYTKGDLAAQARAAYPQGIDAAIDCVGGENAKTTLAMVKDGGAFSYVTAPELAAERGIAMTFVGSGPNRTILEEITEVVDAGKLKAHIDKIVSLPEIPDALSYVESRHAHGKVIATID